MNQGLSRSDANLTNTFTLGYFLHVRALWSRSCQAISSSRFQSCCGSRTLFVSVMKTTTMTTDPGVLSRVGQLPRSSDFNASQRKMQWQGASLGSSRRSNMENALLLRNRSTSTDCVRSSGKSDDLSTSSSMNLASDFWTTWAF